MSGRFAAGVALVLLYALALLSIGLTRDWTLLHEDNGALHTTFALSHVRLGLARTGAHDYFYEPRSGLEGRYGAHPPGPGLVLAAAFWATGSDAPAVARLVAIAFHLGSIACLIALLHRLLGPAPALAGGAIMATLPMGAFFGRMVNYEPLCLFAAMLQLVGYARWRQGARGLGLIALGIVAGGLVDWPALFFAAAIAIALLVDAARGRPAVPALGVVVLAAAGVTLLDVVHLWLVGPGSLGSMRLVDRVLAGPWASQWATLDPVAFVLGQLETARRYYTDAGLVSAIVVAASLVGARWTPAESVLVAPDPATLVRVLAIACGAAVAYVAIAPTWARIHAYWQFYALPFVTIATLLVGRALWRLGVHRGSLLARLPLIVFAADLAIGSATTLHYRHTTPSSHTIRQVAELRQNAMAPSAVERMRPR